METDLFIVDPSDGNKPKKIGSYGLPHEEAKKKFIQEAAAVGATPSKVTPQNPGRTVVVFPQNPSTGKLLDKFDPKKELPRTGDIPGGYILSSEGPENGKYKSAQQP